MILVAALCLPVVFFLIVFPEAEGGGWTNLAPNLAKTSRDGSALLLFLGWFLLVVISPLVLLTRVDLTPRAAEPRRHLAVTAIAAAESMALLAAAAVASIMAAAQGDNAPEAGVWIVPAIAIAAWIFWAVFFWRLGARLFDPSHLAFRWLLRGSVLELMIALSSHIVVRQRSQCCAPVVTAVGVATGLALMLISFGPGIFLLFRAWRDRPRTRPFA